jgi:hypothetical protein
VVITKEATMDLVRKIKRWLFVTSPVLFVKKCWRFRKELAKFRTFDFKYNLDLFCASLEITRDFMLSGDTVSEGGEQTAEEIQHFLDLLKRHHNAIEIAEKELGYEFSPLEDPDPKKDRALITRIESIEETSWLDAFNFLRDKLRNWWD